MYLSGEQLRDVIDGMLARAAHVGDDGARPTHQRNSPRVCLRGSVELAPANGDGGGPAARHETAVVRVRDVSRGGFCFTHHQAMAKGTRLVLRLPRASGGDLAVPCVVRHCRMTGPDRFSIGVQFTSE